MGQKPRLLYSNYRPLFKLVQSRPAPLFNMDSVSLRDLPRVATAHYWAELAGECPATVWNHCNRGVLAHERVGNLCLIEREVFLSWLNSPSPFRRGRQLKRRGVLKSPSRKEEVAPPLSP
jgi:hypothetical protein